MAEQMGDSVYRAHHDVYGVSGFDRRYRGAARDAKGAGRGPRSHSAGKLGVSACDMRGYVAVWPSGRRARQGECVPAGRYRLFGRLLLCGLSASLEVLILARIVQGIGCAAAMANNMGIITESFPARERGRAMGILATFVALGMMCGPVLGGCWWQAFPGRASSSSTCPLA